MKRMVGSLRLSRRKANAIGRGEAYTARQAQTPADRQGVDS
jgi:hypothetical protein